MTTLLAPLRRGFSWARRRLKAAKERLWRLLGRNTPGWGSEPRDAAHAYYRTQYERLVQTLPGLPRTRGNDTNATFLAFSQVVQELHEQGDDPIMPPGIRRIVVRETQRLAQFGAVGQRQGFLAMPGMGSLQLWLGGGLLAFGLMGWGWAMVQGGLKERIENQRDEARAELASAERALIAANAERDLLADAVQQATAQSQQAADTIEAERARRLRAEREARSIRNEMQRARDGVPDIDYGFGSVRDAQSGATPDSGDAAGNRSR